VDCLSDVYGGAWTLHDVDGTKSDIQDLEKF
jgi:hypothetical protein